MTNLNQYISKRHQTMVAKFNAELNEFAKYTDSAVATLYEDQYTEFTLSNVRLENGNLYYEYDGREEHEEVVAFDEESNEYYEHQYNPIADFISFWRSCLRKAKKYYASDMHYLDMLQQMEERDNEEE